MSGASIRPSVPGSGSLGHWLWAWLSAQQAAQKPPGGPGLSVRSAASPADSAVPTLSASRSPAGFPPSPVTLPRFPGFPACCSPCRAKPLASLPPFLSAGGPVAPVASLSSRLGKSLWPPPVTYWPRSARGAEAWRGGLCSLPLAWPSASSGRRALGPLVDRTPHRPRAPHPSWGDLVQEEGGPRGQEGT